ncbi:MAG: transcription elongation factor GreA [Patescibacteria group bacterium]|nr:transcription elongation factor GreA [Patescibacteria group bacterium]
MAEAKHLSKERYDELQGELTALKGEGRARVADQLKKAKEYGDLSENAEYAEAREEQNLMEGKIFELEELLKNAVILTKNEGGSTVKVGSTVVVEKNGKEITYVIVGPYDAKPEQGKISDESPIGKAFLDHHVGDEVKVITPAGKIAYTIKKVE